MIPQDKPVAPASVDINANRPAHDPGLRSPSRTVGALIRGFKGAVTAEINMLRDTPGTPVWQRNYHDHVIRNDFALERIREYIRNNPAEWATDAEGRGM